MSGQSDHIEASRALSTLGSFCLLEKRCSHIWTEGYGRGDVELECGKGPFAQTLSHSLYVLFLLMLSCFLHTITHVGLGLHFPVRRWQIHHAHKMHFTLS